MVGNAKSAEFPEGNFKNDWDRLVSKDASHTALPLLKLKSEQLWPKRQHNLNNFPKKYHVDLNGLENHLTSSGDDVLTIELIHK